MPQTIGQGVKIECNHYAVEAFQLETMIFHLIKLSISLKEATFTTQRASRIRETVIQTLFREETASKAKRVLAMAESPLKTGKMHQNKAQTNLRN